MTVRKPFNKGGEKDEVVNKGAEKDEDAVQLQTRHGCSAAENNDLPIV